MFKVFSVLQLERELPKGPSILRTQNPSFVLLPWWVLILMHTWMLQEVFLWARDIHFVPVWLGLQMANRTFNVDLKIWA